MSFDENVLKTAAKCSESPGDHSTLINTLVSENCSMLPIAVEDSMKVLDMPLLEDPNSININIKLSESNSNDNESYNSSVEDKDCSTRKIFENGSNRIDPTHFVSPIAQEFFGFDTCDIKINVLSDNSTLSDNIECELEAMNISDDCKNNIVEYPLAVSTGKSPVDDCTADNEGDISEFLVFRKTEPQTDTKLEYGCFVKLERISFPVVSEKRKTKTIDRYYPSPKRSRQSRPSTGSKSQKRRTLHSIPCSKRNTTVYKTDSSSSDDSPSRCNEQRKIVLRFVRRNNSSVYKCVKVSDISYDQSDPKRESYQTNVTQPFQPELRSGKRNILPQSNAGSSDGFKDQSDTPNVGSTNVKQPTQLCSRVDKRNILSGSKAQKSNQSKDQTYTNRNVSLRNVKQTALSDSSSEERTMMPASKSEISDRLKDRNVNITIVKQQVQSHSCGHQQNMIPAPKAYRLDSSKDQSYTKENVYRTNLKQPYPSGHERTMLPETTADRCYQIKNQRDANRDVYATNVKQPAQLHSRLDTDKQIILPKSKADNSSYLTFISQSSSQWNCNKMDGIQNNAVDPVEDSMIDPLDLTISKNKNSNKPPEEFTVTAMEQIIVNEKSAIPATSNRTNTIKVKLKELFGSSSSSSDDENGTSSSPKRDLQASNIIDETVVASRDSDDESVCSGLSIFAPSLSDLSDSPTRGERLPPRAERLPPRAERLPPRAERLPPRAERSPSRAERLPPRAERSPSRAERLPPRAERSPSRAERLPPRAESSPPRVQRLSPRVANCQNKIFDLKPFRIPKLKRNPNESAKQLEHERSKIKPQALDTFGNDRNRDVVKTKRQKMVPMKQIIKPTTKPTNTSNAPKSLKSTPKINEPVERKMAESPMVTWKLMGSAEELSIGGSIPLDIPKPTTSRDSDILQPQPKNVVNNVINPSEDIFRTCLNATKCSAKLPLTVSQANRGTINELENCQIQVLHGSSTIRSVRYVSNDNRKKEATYGDTSGLLTTNESHIPLGSIMKGPTATDKPLTLFPMSPKSIFSSPAQMHEQIPQIHEYSTLIKEPIPLMHEESRQIQDLASSLTPGISKVLNSPADFISRKTLQHYRRKITKLFDGPCISFLANRQCDTKCRYKHVLPPCDILKKKLSHKSNEFIQFMYTDFISKNILTFEMYFPLFCQLYGQQKLQPSFYQFIKDCEKFGRVEYFKFIFDGLMLCTLNKKDALLQMLNSYETSSASDEIIFQLNEPDPQCFVEILQMVTPRSKLSSNLVTKLLKKVSDNPEPDLVRNCVNLLEQIGETLLNIDSNVLSTFFGNVFAVKDDALSRKMLTIMSNELSQLKNENM